jgi:hypothetical protein
MKSQGEITRTITRILKKLTTVVFLMGMDMGVSSPVSSLPAQPVAVFSNLPLEFLVLTGILYFKKICNFELNNDEGV